MECSGQQQERYFFSVERNYRKGRMKDVLSKMWERVKRK